MNTTLQAPPAVTPRLAVGRSRVWWQVAWTLAAVALLIAARLRPAPPFTNGSFESAGAWTVKGNVAIVAQDPGHPASDGAALALFNGHDQVGVGSLLSQRVRTTRGQRYELVFDLGTVGAIADQTMRVTVEGNTVLLDVPVVVAGLGAAPSYSQQRLSFVADDTSVAISFADKSDTYVVIDSMLDNVRLEAVTAGAPVITAQPQRLAVADGQRASFGVVASGPEPRWFQWRLNDRDIPGATADTLTVDRATAADAGIYSVVVANANGRAVSSSATLTVLPVARVLNGSFEYGSAAWTFGGTFVSTSTNPGYGTTDGGQLVHFNWGQHEPNGSVSQRFATTPGEAYVLEFDAGAFSRMNRNAQRMEVTLVGARPLLSRLVEVQAPGTGGSYLPQRFDFVADSLSTHLTFRDVSTTTQNVDLLLDNVRVTTAAQSATHAQ